MRSLCLLLFLLCAPPAKGEAPPLQEWIDEAVKAGGGVVTVPAGTHELPAGLHIANAEKLALRGMDKEGCILKLADGAEDQPLIRISGGKTLEVAALTLQGSHQASPLIQAHGREDQAQENLHLRDCLFIGYKGEALSARNIAGLTVERCSFQDGKEALSLDEITQGLIRGNRLIRQTCGLRIQASPALLAEGNEIQDSRQGVLLLRSPGAEAIILRNNAFINVAEALKASSAALPPLLEGNEGVPGK